MIASRRVLALIPARGGSKGVKHKNIRNAGGKPLILWTIEAARQSRYIDRIIVSSDDQEIINTVVKAGCEAPFGRPAELATDQAGTIAVALHALSAVPEHYDYLVLLQPTSPMRTCADIDGAIELCADRDAPLCVSVCEPDKSPYWMLTLDQNQVVTPLFSTDNIPSRRQDAPATFVLNGAIYVATVSHLQAGKTFLAPGAIGYVMPKERSFDVDSEIDLKMVDILLTEYVKKP